MQRVLVLACAFVFAPSAAHAATLTGTVAGAPAVSGKHLVVPLLVKGATVEVTAARVVSRTGKLAAGDLRLGDRVRAEIGRVAKGRARTRVLRVTARGQAPSFATLVERRADAQRLARSALERTSLLDLAGLPAGTPTQLRGELLGVRRELNLLISDLRARARALEAFDAASANEGRTAATDLDTAVARLDQIINDVGGLSAPAINAQIVGAASDVLHGVMDLLDALDGQIDRPNNPFG